MVIRGNARGNGRQLANYLLSYNENEDIQVLEIDGLMRPDAGNLYRALFSMDISSELSKSQKGLYHAQINPAPGEDRLMDDDKWARSADILSKQLGLENQRRAIVLHTKKGRTHAHVVWERYDHENGKMISDSFSRLAQDRARKEMELEFGQAITPHRNIHRPELKTHLTEIWNKSLSGKDFIKNIDKAGYLLGSGVGRTPFMVIDENARSHNLVRQLKGVKLKDVRDLLRKEKLLTEKQAIEQAKKKQSKTGKGTDQQSTSQKINKPKIAFEYSINKANITVTPAQQKKYVKKYSELVEEKDHITARVSDNKINSAISTDGIHENANDKKQVLAKGFEQNKNTIEKDTKKLDKPKPAEQFKDNKRLSQKEPDEDPILLEYLRQMEERRLKKEQSQKIGLKRSL